MADEHTPLTAAEVEAIRVHATEMGQPKWIVWPTLLSEVLPRLLATLDAYREIARAVARMPGVPHADLGRTCPWCADYLAAALRSAVASHPHATDCPVAAARALLGVDGQP